jgi:tetratricopeptide (TPR) repeat protein
MRFNSSFGEGGAPMSSAFLRRSRAWLLAALLPGVLLSPSRGDDPPPANAAEATAQELKLQALIEQLGDSDFATRERAQAELAKLGLEAFDALHAAQSHNVPEIALRARYLVRSMNVRWFSETDGPEVVRILKEYGDLSEADRRNRMERLAALENRQGFAALVRLARFDTNDPLAKYAALKILEAPPPADEATKAELAKTIRGIVGSSKRPAASWLALYARSLADPAATLAEWDKTTQAEYAALSKTPEKTSEQIVRDLYRYQVETLKRLSRNDEAIAVIRRTFALTKDGMPDSVLEIVDWLMQMRAWPVALEALQQFEKTVQASPELLYRQAETYQQLGQIEQAEAMAKKALSLRPENLEEHLVIGFILEEKRGLHAWAQREYREVLKSAAAGSVADFKARFRLSELLHDQAQELPAAEALKPVCELMQKDEAAKEACLRAYRSPEGVIARMHYFYACHFHEQKDAAQERKHLEQAIESDPTDADALISMYRLPGADAAWKEKTQKAIEETTELFSKEIEEWQQRYDAADNEQVRSGSSEQLSQACNQYAWLVGNTFGDFDRAVLMSHKSLELRPGTYSYLDTLGRAYYGKGDLVNAVKYQTQALKLSPYSGQLRRQLEFFVSEAKAKGVELPAQEGTRP